MYRLCRYLVRWQPIFHTPLTFTPFTSPFHLPSSIKPLPTKPCIVLFLDVLIWQVPWLGDLDLYVALQWLDTFYVDIRYTTTKPCIVLHLIVLAWQVPWPGDLDLYLKHFTLMFDNSSTIRPTTTISCISLMYWLGRYLDLVTLTYSSHPSDFYTFYVDVPLSLGCIIRKVSAEDIAIGGNGTGSLSACFSTHFPTKHC